MKKKSKKVTVTKQYIERLKAEAKHNTERANELELDVKKFRSYFIRQLRKNVEMIAKNQYQTPQTVVESLSQLMNDVKPFYFGVY